jgi:cysteine desulfurase
MSLSTKTVLVTCAYVNSEIGTVEDVKRVTRVVRAHNKENGTNTRVHLDAAQAPLWLPCEMDMLGVDLISFDSGKCYGPKGVGVLAFRHGIKLSPVLFGGGQEGGLRSGTENTPLIVGCTEALVRAQVTWEVRALRVRTLRDRMLDLLLRTISGVVVNGSRADRVANNVNVSIPGIDAEYAVITLDHHGIAASTKSACGVGDATGSAVVRELTHDDARARSTIRFTLGEETTDSDIEAAVRVLNTHVTDTRAFTTTV